jgi:hypothetical protein
MKLPSHHQSEAKDWPTPFDRPRSEQQGTDPQPSMVAGFPGEGDRALPTQKRTQAAPWKSFLALGMVSLGLHLLALRIPVPALQSVSKINPPIKVTRLTVTPKPRRSPPRAIPKPTSIVVKPKVVAPSPSSQNRAGSPVAIAPTRKPLPTAIKSSQPISSTPVSQGSPSSQPSTAPTSTQKPDREFKDFPTYPGSVLRPDSPMLTIATDFKTVADYLYKKLTGDPKQHWNVQEITDQPSGVRVYQVKKGGRIKFLSIFSEGQLGTAYALTDRQTTLDALKKEEEAIANVGSILAELNVQATDDSLLAQPERFKRGEAEIVSKNFVEDILPEQFFDKHLSTSLMQNGFKMPKLSDYGGGAVYELNRESFTGYLNLLPSNDGTGTVIVFWKVPPV